MEVFVNGTPRDIAQGSTLAQLIEALEIGTSRLAVEVNREVIPRSAYHEHRLKGGDRIEIVRAIGGG
jgi:thiamine biosynthesis protein ThiS